MSFSAQCGVALARGTAVGVCGVLAGAAVRALLGSSARHGRRFAWAALLVPYLTPALLIGYAYSNFSLSLVRHPTWNELFYDLVVWMKLVPISAFVLYFAPSPLSPAAVHCRRLLRSRESGLRARLSYLWFLVCGPLRAYGVAFALVFMLAFAEFEMASLFGVRTWSVALFDAHAGGLALSKSLRLMAFPLALEIGILLIALFAFLGKGSAAGAAAQRRVALGPGGRALAWGYLALAAFVLTVLPSLIVLRGTVQGFWTLAHNFVWAKDIAASLCLGVPAAACAFVAAALVARLALAPRTSGSGFLGAFCLSVPGLLGPLVLSLLVLWAFQSALLRTAYHTVLPLVLSLSLVVLPFAVLLEILLRVLRPAEALHAANLLRPSASKNVQDWRRGLVWELKNRPQFWVAFLLFCLAYFDLTASSILAPSGMTPVFVRLYNLTHYGQSAVLSAMVCVAFGVPFALLLLAAGARRLTAGLIAHV